MPVKKARLLRAAAAICALALASCGGGSKAPTTAVGVGIGVLLSSPTATTLVAEGATVEIDAAVSNDPTNTGVTWTVNGDAGTLDLTKTTTTKAFFVAKTGVTGSLFATLTAISKADTTKGSSVTLTVNGTPTIAAPVLFPANQNVPYLTYINVAGGTAPFTWTVSTGTLPAGLVLNGSTAASVAISGTPTAIASSTFTLTAKDSAIPARTATVTLTLVVNPQTACLLLGRYAFSFTGFAGGRPMVRAGSFNVASDGTVTGIEDYKDAGTGRVASQVTGGVCKTKTQNRGTLVLTTGSGSETYDFGTVSSLQSGQLQENDGSGTVGSGQFFHQDPTEFSRAALAADYVFGLVGDDGAGHRLATAGRFTLGLDGVLSGGVADNNAATPVQQGTLSATLSAPDANGRGTGTLSLGSQSLPIAYYVYHLTESYTCVTASDPLPPCAGKADGVVVRRPLAPQAFIVSADGTAGTPRLGGHMQRQTGAPTLDATALANPAVLSLWGSSRTNNVAVTTVAAGRLSGAVPAAGTVNVLLDVTDRSTTLVNATYTAMPYAVDPVSGRATLAIGSGASLRHFVIYADGSGGGFVIEPVSLTGNFGILERQLGAPFTTFPTAYYVGGTLNAGSTSPITLAPQLLLQSGSIGGNLTGNFAFDLTTGRMIASVTRNILGGTGLAIYVVSTDKIVILGDGVNAINSQLGWFQHF